MVAHSDRHFRRLMRLVAPRASIYTEMLVAQAIVFGDSARLLGFSDAEHPVIAQLGGAEPTMLADATQIVSEFGYDAINLNVGCPSKRVQTGGFGACLMEDPDLVFQLVRAMKNASSLPITVKCRLGTDRVSGYPWLLNFVTGLRDHGADAVVIHARIARLDGFSTRYNLNVPPLEWHQVERLQDDLPNLPITLNGGIQTLQDLEQVQAWTKQVMVGRVALNRPDVVAAMHAYLYGEDLNYSPRRIATTYRDYMVEQLNHGVPLKSMTRHLLSLFHGVRGSKRYRQHLSLYARDQAAGIEIFDEAVSMLQSFNTVGSHNVNSATASLAA